MEQKDKKILPHKKTLTRITVDEKVAMESSLKQMGSGIKLTGKLRKNFEEMVLKKTKK